jgi:hypothetical protein
MKYADENRQCPQYLCNEWAIVADLQSTDGVVLHSENRAYTIKRYFSELLIFYVELNFQCL